MCKKGRDFMRSAPTGGRRKYAENMCDRHLSDLLLKTSEEGNTTPLHWSIYSWYMTIIVVRRLFLTFNSVLVDSHPTFIAHTG